MRYLFVLLLVWCWVGSALAQLPDSSQTSRPDSAALQRFNRTHGPAEGVVSFFGTSPLYRFQTGTYRLADADFPLWQSPDSLVQQPLYQSVRRRRTARIIGRATIVPLAVLSYCGIRLVMSLGSAASGQSTNLDHVRTLLPISGYGSVAGIFVSGTFNLASSASQLKSIRRHNRHFGRSLPTLFNPKGL
jgi:hypothetical protein